MYVTDLDTVLTYIKDISTVVLAITATIISILTYNRAKATILQPIRNEVVKKQSILLSDLLELVSGDIDKKIDYFNIVGSTLHLTLKLYGFVFKDEKDILDEIKKDVAGQIYCGKSETIRDTKVIGVFDNKNDKDDEEDDIGRTRYNELKDGIVNIEWIFITKDYKDFHDKIVDYSNNPFLPHNIQSILKDLLSDIENNLCIALRDAMSDSLKEFSDAYFNECKILPISSSGLYNDFNHRRINHKSNIDNVRISIRTHLKIDDKWC